MISKAGNGEGSASTFQPLIDSIRREAIEQAEAETQRMLSKAQEQARTIIEEAEKESKEIENLAQTKASQFEKASRDSLKRASRDVLLGLESTLRAQLDEIIKHRAAEATRGEGLARIVNNLTTNWRGETGQELEALVNPADLDKFRDDALASLAEHLLAGVELKPSPRVSAGLHIGLKDGSSHYDFSAQTMAEWLGRSVSPRLREILSEAAQTESNSNED